MTPRKVSLFEKIQNNKSSELGRPRPSLTALEGSEAKVLFFSREQVKRALLADGSRTKHVTAEIIAKRFPEELDTRLAPKRHPWMSEELPDGYFRCRCARLGGSL